MTRKTFRPPLREAIIDAAIATFASNPGASLSDVAARAGVGRASLHRYFRSRADLITAISHQCLSEIEAATRSAVEDAGSARETLLRMLEAVIPLGDRFHFLAQETPGEARLQERYAGQLQWVAGLVDELKADGVMAIDVPRSWAVANIDAQIWLAWSEVTAGNLAPAHAAGLAFRTLLKGLGP